MAKMSAQLALDTNVLMALGRGSDSAHQFREVFLEHDYRLQVSPTALRELGWLEKFGHQVERTEAATALDSLKDWQLQTFGLNEAQRNRAGEFSGLLRSRGLLPVAERNDGRILGEASIGRIPVLVTHDP